MGLKVLIVDDSSIMRKILQRSLSVSSSLDIGSYVEAANGPEAMAKIESEGPIGMVFSDVDLPNGGGIEFLRTLGASPHSRVPVIMVAGEAGEQTVMLALQNGAKGFVMKPFTPEHIHSAVRNVL